MSKIAFMFPGQGAQIAGMGKDFYEHSQNARDIIDEASENLKLNMKKMRSFTRRNTPRQLW